MAETARVIKHFYNLAVLSKAIIVETGPDMPHLTLIIINYYWYSVQLPVFACYEGVAAVIVNSNGSLLVVCAVIMDSSTYGNR